MDAQELDTLIATLEQESLLKEKLRDAASDLEKGTRVMMARLMSIHYTTCEKMPILLDTIQPSLETCTGPVTTIAELVPPQQYWRWKDLYSRQIQNVVFVVVLCEYLRSHKLSSLQDVSNMLGLKQEWYGRVHVQAEDYLHGVLSVVSELTRFAINCVTMQNYEEPFRVHSFVNDIFAGFSMLNLKNDTLRRRFDALKYDLKKLEEVVYDLSIRKLGPNKAAEGS
ncbi:Translin [Serendipita vermifera]|nr:Translin [Serendipita vermifera]